MAQFVLILTCCLLAWLSARFVKGEGEFSIPAGFTIFWGMVTCVGYALSGLGLFGSAWSWASGLVISGAALFALQLYFPKTRLSSPSLLVPSGLLRVAVWWLAAVALTCFFMQLLIVLASAPHNSDSMTYHMPRVGYYLQHGTVAWFEANFWAQQMHLKNSAVAMSLLVLASDGWSNAAQFLQLSSWPVLVAALYGISIRLGVARSAALLTALAGGLINEVLMQATTTQDDLYIAALCACYLYAGICVLQGGGAKYWLLAFTSAGLAFGTKSSALLPALSASLTLACLAWAIDSERRLGERLRSLTSVALACLLGGLVFGIPAGYLENQRLYGSPLGDAAVMASKTLDGASIGDHFRLGVVNAGRFAVDFIDPSGLPADKHIVEAVRTVRGWAGAGLQEVGVDLAEAPTLDGSYVLSEGRFQAHEDFAYWGPWGWLFFLPLTALAFCVQGWRKVAVSLAIGSVCFWGLQSFLGVYDHWRGRYFIQVIIFVAPMAAAGAAFSSRQRFGRCLLVIVILICSVASVGAIVRRQASPWLTTLKMDWTQQVTRNSPWLDPVFRRIDSFVPQEASLIVSLNMAFSEFPLFGERMTRSLYPAPNRRVLDGLLEKNVADYIVFNQILLPMSSDCYLGGGYYLRRTDGLPVNGCSVSWVKRLADIDKVADAVEKYRSEHGSYPISLGWDGFQSRWGDPSAVWVKNVAPRYIAQLPVASRERADDWAMYLYRSDGVDYKLIVLAADDGAEVKRYFPGRMDDARVKGVYGRWSPGAGEWAWSEGASFK
ncbi:hypothetical protein [Stenotrophomonas sp.]|uniref:hypothetical protein n=1 Tax=Stenotrophomonas sp. TaxID=69392 RepID=UPI0028A8DE92|nr:hypothetical protein [Stenotrophomonas sp.]